MPRAPSHSSGGSTPPHPHHLRYLQRSYDIKVDIPEFVWKMQPDNFIDWLTTIEWVFNFKDVPNNCKVKIVAIKLRKHASIWWEHLKRQRQREGRDHIVTWEKMKRELKKKYLLDHFKKNAFLRFHNFKKKELSVEEYISKFDLLMTRCDIVEPKEQMIAYYLGGLCVELSDVVQLQTYWTYNDVCKLSMKVKKQLKERHGSNFRSYNREGVSNWGNGSTSKVVALPETTTVKQPPKNESASSSNHPNIAGTGYRCFKCQGFEDILLLIVQITR